MKISLNEYEFADYFNKSETYKDNFSYEGKKALFDYLTEYEDETGTEIDFDLVSICCDFTEYADLDEIKDTYPQIKSIDDLRDNTQVIEFEGGIIIQDF